MQALKCILDVRDKKKLTEDLIKLLSDEDSVGMSFAMAAWWFNIRRHGGMRLTGIGYRTFTEDLDLENYAYPIDDPLLFNQRTILKLDRKMQTPYYIHAVKGIPKRIVFLVARKQ